MTTMQGETGQQRPAAVERLVAWTLDHGGTMYGDEQERLRWYEGSVAAASLQAVLVPWVVAVGVWVGGRAVAPYLAVLALVYYLPWLVATAYVRRRRVRPTPRITRKFVLIALAANLPYPVLLIGLLVAWFPPAPGRLGGALAGAAVGSLGGGLLAWAALRLRARLRPDRSPAAAAGDTGEDDDE